MPGTLAGPEEADESSMAYDTENGHMMVRGVQWVLCAVCCAVCCVRAVCVLCVVCGERPHDGTNETGNVAPCAVVR